MASIDTSELEGAGNRRRSYPANRGPGYAGPAIRKSGEGVGVIYSQYILGVPFLVGIGLAALDVATEYVHPTVGIEVHQLQFTNADGPAIAQSRTVHAQSKIVAQWSAVIREDGEIACKGGGSWNYPAGTASPVIPIDDWVGDKGCWERLRPDAILQACAKYEWGDGEHSEACTLGFRKVE